MSNAIKVGLFAAAALAVLAFLILRVEDFSFFSEDAQRVDAVFDSVAGLDDKAPVRVAGVRIGRVDGISLEGRRARVSLLLEQPVELTVGTRASIASVGLLGDKYVELIPGPPGAPALDPSTLLEGETPVSFDAAMEKISTLGDSLTDVTGTLADSITGRDEDSRISRLLANLETVSAQVRDLLRDNRSQVDATVRNFESASATLAAELPRLTERMEAVLAQVAGVVDENRGELSTSLENLADLTERLKPAVDDLGVISGRLAAGEGSVGKLLTSDEAHDQLVSTLGTIEEGVDSLSETLGGIQQIGFDLNLGGFYLAETEESQASFTLDIDTRSSWLYRGAVVDTAAGKEKSEIQRITTTEPDGTSSTRTIETVTLEDDLSFTALLGHEIGGDFRLYTGLVESSFGIQAQYPLLERKLWLTLEAFDFDREQDLDPHLRLTGEWRFHPNLYLLGGYDDPLVEERRSIFLGGGVRWNDDDLKYLFGAIPNF